MSHKFPYKWYLKDGYTESHGYKVFGTFICGGGSTMGYKLAGFEHLGGVEIDKEVAEVYKENHNPKYLFNEDIRNFNKRKDLPEELFNLDILDGSPPCSSFSMAGNREKDWGKKKKFREGQACQTLDDLFFDYIELAKRLQPKIVIAENVKGLIQGNAKVYVKKIKSKFEEAGYKVQMFLLNAASMGVPQKRERVFFVCQRKDLGFKPLNLQFNEKAILFGEVKNNEKQYLLSENMKKWWLLRREGDIGFEDITKREKGANGSLFNHKFLYNNKVANTITTSGLTTDFYIPRYLSDYENKIIGSYPLDYNFKKIKPQYLIGMSVPPVMMAQIADQIHIQWLKGK